MEQLIEVTELSFKLPNQTITIGYFKDTKLLFRVLNSIQKNNLIRYELIIKPTQLFNNDNRIF